MNEQIKQLVQAELQRANEINGDFHSIPEGYAIIKEEYEETVEELMKIDYSIIHLWLDIRNDNSKNTKNNIKTYIRISENLIQEAIQLSAMLNKLKNIL